MIAAFNFAFGGREEDKHIELAAIFMRELRKTMPSVEIIQLSDKDTMRLGGVDGCFRTEAEGFGEWTLKAASEFPADEYLHVDYDVIVRQDVSHVFDEPFDLAIAEEVNGLMNGGAMFVRNRKLFADTLAYYRSKSVRDHWGDIQAAIQVSIDSGKYLVKRLSCDYNFFPKKDDSPIPDSVKIVHYKGARKQIMLRDYSDRVRFAA